MSSESLHEDHDALGSDVVDFHRAIVSVMEELEAIDWYNQRAKATEDAELRAVLEHNRDEEKEHAAMTLEWLRRMDPVLARHLRTYLFTERPIVAVEEVAKHGSADAQEQVGNDESLGIGSLRKAGQ